MYICPSCDQSEIESAMDICMKCKKEITKPSSLQVNVSFDRDACIKEIEEKREKGLKTLEGDALLDAVNEIIQKHIKIKK